MCPTNLVIEGAHHLLEEHAYGAGLGQVGGDTSLMQHTYVLDSAARGGEACSES